MEKVLETLELKAAWHPLSEERRGAQHAFSTPTDRVLEIRQRILDHAKPYFFCSERALIVTDVYRRTEGLPIDTRRAAVMRELLEKMSVYIMPGELIVGQNTKEYVGAPVFPETDTAWLEEELALQDRNDMGVEIPKMSERVKKDFREIVKYWRGKSLRHVTWARIPANDRLCREKLVYMESMDPAAIGRTMIDVRKVIASGFAGIKKEIGERIAQCPPTAPHRDERIRFWKAAAEVCGGMIRFGARYAEEARRLAAAEGSARRREELLAIARICDRVPAHPARTFREAIQSCWFTQLVALSEHGGEGPAPGRLDQYLYPLYQSDLEAGRITPPEAQELLDLYFLKGNETPKPRPSSSFIKFGRSGNINVNNHITIGGVDRNGCDATNDLSYMLLEAQAHIHLPRPQTSIRIHSQSPQDLVDKAIRVNSLGGGLPQFIGDDAVVTGLLSRGLSLQDARDFTMLGCSTVCAHALYGRLHMVWFNIPKVLELALNNGVDRMTGETVGSRTGDPRAFRSFDEVADAFKVQLKFALDAVEAGVIVETEALKEEFPLVYTSIVVDDCIRKGKDLTQGGARYNWGGTATGVGVVTAGESLYAIRKAVFEDGILTMAELIDALDANFGGREELRQTLWNKIPRYGNDEDGVDGMVRQTAAWYYDEVECHSSPNGGKIWPEFHSVTFHVPLGMATGAMPNGRKSGEPHQTGITATSGCDRKGPTALCRSAGKLDLTRANAASLFLTTTPEAVAAADKCRKFSDIVRTYLTDLKGLHVQTNVVSPEVLRDAQADPESYRNLVVRVAGYSAFFVELDKKLQDDIIRRTVQPL